MLSLNRDLGSRMQLLFGIFEFFDGNFIEAHNESGSDRLHVHYLNLQVPQPHDYSRTSNPLETDIKGHLRLQFRCGFNRVPVPVGSDFAVSDACSRRFGRHSQEKNRSVVRGNVAADNSHHTQYFRLAVSVSDCACPLYSQHFALYALLIRFHACCTHCTISASNILLWLEFTCIW